MTAYNMDPSVAGGYVLGSAMDAVDAVGGYLGDATSGIGNAIGGFVGGITAPFRRTLLWLVGLGLAAYVLGGAI